MKFGENLPRSFFEILKSKFQKSEVGKFIPNFPLKHVITSTNFENEFYGRKGLEFIEGSKYGNCVRNSPDSRRKGFIVQLLA